MTKIISNGVNEKSMTTPQSAKSSLKMNSSLIIAIVVIIIIVGAGLFYSMTKKAVAPSENNQPAASQKVSQPSGLDNNQTSVVQEKAAKIFNLTAMPFKFSLTEIRVDKGDRVRINLAVIQGLHDWVIDEFNARTKQITAGQSDSVEFTANQAGTFEYYCSVDGHRQLGMVGKLIVNE